jgi:pre-rRNA-processing protein TSR3
MLRFEILMDKKENPRKCTIHPVGDRPDFSIRYFSKNRPIPAFTSSCLLHIDGEDLSAIPRGAYDSVAMIDCIWRTVEPTLKRVARPLPKLVKIPEGFTTAYPRMNKKGLDPDGGLATIEALFIAAAFLGMWDESLLAKYHFGAAFLKDNEASWRKFQLGPYGN